MILQMINLQAQQPSLFSSLLPMIIVLFIIYFFFIRPQAKKQKEQSNFLSNIKKGDDVVTASGMIGKVSKVDGNEVTIQVGEKVFLPFVKNAISKEMTESYNAANTENS
jgi:preprotein translocase subunit YajC